MKEPLAEGQYASKLSLALNAALAAIKLATGIAGNSYALVADAIESLGDIFSSAIVWSGLRIASKPADDNHPYGHGKAEPLATLAVAILLLVAGVGIAFGAIREVRAPHQTPASYTLIVLLGVVAIKETMYRYESRIGKRVGSTAIHADAWHHRCDGFTSAAAAVGIAIALIGGKGYESADDWAALAACAVIVTNGVRFARTAIAELMDTTPDATLIDDIRSWALDVEGAQFVEKIFVRKMGPMLYVDLHLEVDPDITVRRAHEIGHAVKRTVIANQPRVADVLVHLEPNDPSRTLPSGKT